MVDQQGQAVDFMLPKVAEASTGLLAVGGTEGSQAEIRWCKWVLVSHRRADWMTHHRYFPAREEGNISVRSCLWIGLIWGSSVGAGSEGGVPMCQCTQGGFVFVLHSRGPRCGVFGVSTRGGLVVACLGVHARGPRCGVFGVSTRWDLVVACLGCPREEASLWRVWVSM